jgi:hypothetical protein
MGLDNDAKRDEAMEKWLAVRKTLKLPPRPEKKAAPPP